MEGPETTTDHEAIDIKEPAKLIPTDDPDKEEFILTLSRTPSNYKYRTDLAFIQFALQSFHDYLSSDIGYIQKNIPEIRNLSETKEISDFELRVIKLLINCDVYKLHSRLMEPNFYVPEQILKRYETMKAVIEEMSVYIANYRLDSLIYFSTEAECVRAFEKIFSEELFAQPYFRRVSAEIYRSVIKRLDAQKPAFARQFYESLKLFLYDISLPTDQADDYPFHKAVYDSDVEYLKTLCSGTQMNCFYAHLEQGDTTGVTPLLLAVKLQKTEIVKLLLDNGADPKHRAVTHVRYPLEEAVLVKHRKIMRMLMIAGFYWRQRQWEKTRVNIMKILRTIPDFSFDIHWEFNSSCIPFLNRFAPRDHNKIWKRGTSLRLDATVLDYMNRKASRDQRSFYFLGADHPGYEGQLLMVNETQRTVTNLITEINLTQIDAKIEELIKQELAPDFVQMDKIRLEHARSWAGESITAKIQNFNTAKMTFMGKMRLHLITRPNDDLVPEEHIDPEEKGKPKLKPKPKDKVKVVIENYEQYLAKFGNKPRYWVLPSEEQDLGPIDLLISYTNSNSELSERLFERNAFELDNRMEAMIKKFGELKKGRGKVKKLDRNMGISFWLTDSFPLNFGQIVKVLDILTLASPNIAQLHEYLGKAENIHESSFPLRIQIPFYMTVSAFIHFRNFAFRSPDKLLFDGAKARDLTNDENYIYVVGPSELTPEKPKNYETTDEEIIQLYLQEYQTKGGFGDDDETGTMRLTSMYDEYDEYTDYDEDEEEEEEESNGEIEMVNRSRESRKILSDVTSEDSQMLTRSSVEKYGSILKKGPRLNTGEETERNLLSASGTGMVGDTMMPRDSGSHLFSQEEKEISYQKEGNV